MLLPSPQSFLLLAPQVWQHRFIGTTGLCLRLNRNLVPLLLNRLYCQLLLDSSLVAPQTAFILFHSLFHLKPSVLWAVVCLNRLLYGRWQGFPGAPFFYIAHTLIPLSSSNFEAHTVFHLSVPCTQEYCASQTALSLMSASWIITLPHPGSTT